MPRPSEILQNLRATVASSVPGDLETFDRLADPFEAACLAAVSGIALARYGGEPERAIATLKRAAEMLELCAETAGAMADSVRVKTTKEWIEAAERREKGPKRG